jgi:anti-sigma factor ChrR (cupin superfamily)
MPIAAQAASTRGDLARRTVVDTGDMDWVQSPSPTVWRKRLDHIGPVESGRVTSLVRFEPGASFPMHPHPDGEEILVLSGSFCDHTGRYGPGSFLVNPEGFSHAPFTDEGCTLFVKLRQLPGAGRQHLALDTDAMPWQDGAAPGRRIKQLYRQDGFAEQVRLVELDAGVQISHHDHPGGEEVFVLEGSISDEDGHYPAGTWFRLPDGSAHAPWTEDGCRLYVRVGHLPAAG